MAERTLFGINIAELLSLGLDALTWRALGMRVHGSSKGSTNSSGDGSIGTEAQKRDRVAFGFLSTKDEERYGELWQALGIHEQRALIRLKESLLAGLAPDISNGLVAKAARDHLWDGLRKKITNMEVSTVSTEENVSDDPQTGKKRVGKKTTRQESKGLLYLKWLAGIVIMYGTAEAKEHLRTGNMIPDEAPFLWIATHLSPSSLAELNQHLRGNAQTKMALQEERGKTTETLRWIGIGAFIAVIILIVSIATGTK